MKKFMMRARNDFFTGIAIVLPIAITIAILDFILKALNKKLLEPIVTAINPYMTGPYVTLMAKIIILLLIFIGITLIGIAGRILIVRRFFTFWERILMRVPMVRNIYGGTKQLSKAFLGEGKAVFKNVALVEYPRKGVYSIAFVTTVNGKKELVDKTERKLVSLFVPTTPNPTSGMFIAVPKEEVKFLDMSIEDGFKLIISAGAV
jgi:uncharacterized membrane protein